MDEAYEKAAAKVRRSRDKRMERIRRCIVAVPDSELVLLLRNSPISLRDLERGRVGGPGWTDLCETLGIEKMSSYHDVAHVMRKVVGRDRIAKMIAENDREVALRIADMFREMSDEQVEEMVYDAGAPSSLVPVLRRAIKMDVTTPSVMIAAELAGKVHAVNAGGERAKRDRAERRRSESSTQEEV